MPDHESALRNALNKLFTAFPPHSQVQAAQAQKQYELYYERLREMPVDLVESAILELIDTATFMPRIGTIRGRVQAGIKRRINLASSIAPPTAADRVHDMRSVSQTPPIGEPPAQHEKPPLVTGACPRIRNVDGVREPCGRPYEYTATQARWLQGQGEHLLCTHCAGGYLDRQGDRRRSEATWAASLLARLSPHRRPSAEEVKRLRMYGFDRQLQERLIAIGAYSARRAR